MTGSNTDPVFTPFFVQGGALLLRLSGPLMDLVSQHPEMLPYSSIYNAWFQLRKTEQVFLAGRSCHLTPTQMRSLVTALKVAHDYRHDTDPAGAPPVEVCHCDVSETVRDLIELMTQDAKRRAEVAA